MWEFVRDEDNTVYDQVVLTNSYVQKSKESSDQMPADQDDFEPFVDDPNEL